MPLTFYRLCPGCPDNTHEWWKPWLTEETRKPYFNDLVMLIADSHEHLENDRGIYPPKECVFKAFEYGEPSVVIIGQDPYPTPGNAMGLAFSTNDGAPQSLLTIYKELMRDPAIGMKTAPRHGDLTGWANQSVMLLNTALTVREGKAGSHLGLGWITFTEHVIDHINKACNAGVVFMLWGNHAQSFARLIDKQKHHVLAAGHPSPLNRTHPFIGCGHFSMANQLLLARHRRPVDWDIVEKLSLRQ